MSLTPCLLTVALHSCGARCHLSLPHSNAFSAEVQAVAGTVVAPMEKFENTNPSYVSWPGSGNTQSSSGSGKVTFSFTTKSQTWVRFSLEVLCASYSDNSFYLQVDDENPYQWSSIQVRNSFGWQTCPKWWNLAPGNHVLHVIAREDGAKLSKLKFANGDALFSVSSPSPSPPRPSPSPSPPSPSPSPSMCQPESWGLRFLSRCDKAGLTCSAATRPTPLLSIPSHLSAPGQQ